MCSWEVGCSWEVRCSWEVECSWEVRCSWEVECSWEVQQEAAGASSSAPPSRRGLGGEMTQGGPPEDGERHSREFQSNSSPIPARFQSSSSRIPAGAGLECGTRGAAAHVRWLPPHLPLVIILRKIEREKYLRRKRGRRKRENLEGGR